MKEEIENNKQEFKAEMKDVKEDIKDPQPESRAEHTDFTRLSAH